jgi:hypothetical protein
MIWKRRLWPLINHYLEFAWRNHENHKRPQSGEPTTDMIPAGHLLITNSTRMWSSKIKGLEIYRWNSFSENPSSTVIIFFWMLLSDSKWHNFKNFLHYETRKSARSQTRRVRRMLQQRYLLPGQKSFYLVLYGKAHCHDAKSTCLSKELVLFDKFRSWKVKSLIDFVLEE